MTKDVTPFNILVVEDNPGDFLLVEDCITEKLTNTTITHVRDFKETAEALKNCSNCFDVILLDLTLPDKSGQNLILEILKISTGASVIVLTGYSDIDFSIQSISMGVSDYLLKEDLNANLLYKSILYCNERRKKTAELEESEKRYSDLFNLNPLPMWAYDAQTLQFLEVNDAAVKHYNYTREQFLSMTLKEIFVEEDLPKLEAAIQNALNNHDIFLKGVFMHKKQNGEIIKVEVQRKSILYKNKQAQVALVNDITERTNYINAIEKQNAKLREIAWIQSHVVRAPLARMMGLVELFKSQHFSDQEKEQLFQFFFDSANELDTLIKDISNKTYEAKLE